MRLAGWFSKVWALGLLLTWTLGNASGQAPAPRAAQAEQAPSAKPPVPPEARGPVFVRTFYLSNVATGAEANELQTVLRNLLDPRTKIYLVASRNAIVVQVTQSDLDLIEKVISDLDRPRKTFRLTYTITEMDGTKRVGTQHFSMVVVAGQRTVMKQGSKVPIATTPAKKDKDGTQDHDLQISYMDIGLVFDATLDEFANGGRLRSLVEQTSLVDDKPGLGAQDPVIRQANLEGTSVLVPGKPMMLGTMDIPGSTRRLDIEVVMEQAL